MCFISDENAVLEAHPEQLAFGRIGQEFQIDAAMSKASPP